MSDPGPDVSEAARAQAAAMWADDRASQAAGIAVDDVGPGTARAQMAVRADMVNGHGMAHGGYVFLLADTAFALACNTRGAVTVASGGDVAFLAPVREGDVLVATATEQVRRGRSGVYDVVVRREDEVVALLRGRSREVGPGR